MATKTKRTKARVGNPYIFDRTSRDILKLSAVPSKRGRAKKIHSDIFDARSIFADAKDKNMARSVLGSGKMGHKVLGTKEDRRLAKSILS